jgi:TatA/E family protein of Tat protein translocase
MGPLGVPELIFIFVLALLIFGPKKLPELGRSFGKGMAEFRRASNELKATFQREMDAIDHENREVKDVAKSFQRDISSHYYDDSKDNYYSDYGQSASSSETSAKPSTQPADDKKSEGETALLTSESHASNGGVPESSNGRIDSPGPSNADNQSPPDTSVVKSS